MESREPYITGGSKMREIKFSFMWQHKKDGNWIDSRYTLDQVIAGDPYDDMSDNPMLRPYHHKHTREFTGLKDKNGKEIYEGDVVKVISLSSVKELYWLYVITTAQEQFGNTLFAMLIEENLASNEEGFYTYEITKHDKDIRQYVPSGEDCEIMGNVYENPELLK